MIIYCGNGISFSVNNLKNDASVFLNLLSVYFCFDIDYPACYPILPLLEYLCCPEISSIQDQGQVAPPTKKSKKIKSTTSQKLSNPLSKMPVACKQFLRNFQVFLSSNWYHALLTGFWQTCHYWKNGNIKSKILNIDVSKLLFNF